MTRGLCTVGVVEVAVEYRSDQLLPDPEPRPVEVTIISVDDHLVEPPDMFEGRLAARFSPYQPRVVEDAEGHQLWEFDGGLYTQGKELASQTDCGSNVLGQAPDRLVPLANWPVVVGEDA